MNSLVLKKNISNLSTTQKTFNRLRNKIKKLQQKSIETQGMLDETLAFYVTNVKPAETEEAAHLTEYIKILYAMSKSQTKLKPTELKKLKQLIPSMIQDVFRTQPLEENESNQELWQIFKELKGFDLRDVDKEQINGLKDNMESFFGDMELDIDLSEMNIEDEEEDLIFKFFEAMSKSNINELKEKQTERKKSAKELKKEAKQKELEDIQKNGIGGIYKRLAKKLHPDLEQNSTLKIQKEILMKRLTVANQNNDLYTILSIEMESTELIGDIETKETATSDELLKIYNSILKDQVEALENDIDLLYSHPKYITINQCISDPFYSPLVSLKIALNQALYA
jgi:hypothetical protein